MKAVKEKKELVKEVNMDLGKEQEVIHDQGPDTEKNSPIEGKGPDTPPEPLELVVKTDALNAIVKYMSTRPYQEVAGIINLLQSSIRNI